MLTEQQQQEFRERGFVFTEPVFTPSELEPVRRSCLAANAELDVQQDLEPYQRMRPFLPDIAGRDEAVRAFTHHKVFQGLARQLIGPEVDQTWTQACIKMPDTSGQTEFPLHQDGKFAEVNHSTTGFGCFIALRELTVDNGTLTFLPGGHRGMREHVWDERLHWWRCDPGDQVPVPAVLPPGAMVIYHPMTPHGGPPNTTPAAREAFLVAFNLPGVCRADTGEPFGDARPFLRGGEFVSPAATG